MPDVIWFLLVAALLVVAAAGSVASRRRAARRGPTAPPTRSKASKGPVPRPPRRPPVPTVKPRSGKVQSSTAPKQRSASKPSRVPTAGEIWIARVPYHGEPGAKVRPCVVLRTTAEGAEVLKITSQNHLDQGDHIEIATKGWDSRAQHNSYLDLSDPYQVPADDFHKKIGEVDDATWAVVRQWHKLPERTRP